MDASSMERTSQWVAFQVIPSDLAVRIADEVLFPGRASSPGRRTPELAALSPASFGEVVAALLRRRADPEVIATAVTAYAELALADPVGNEDRGAALLESVVRVLPSPADAPLPAAFLCRLLHAAVNAGASADTCRDLELRVAAVLDRATAGDLLRVANTDAVRRVVAAFVERQAPATGRGRRPSSLSGGAGLGPSTSTGALERVAKTVDELAAEIAAEEALPVSEFVGVAGAVPRDARATHDWLYRAVDVYLKAHPALDEVQREKVCSVMDPLRLSYQARLHAAQNRRLPLQAVLSALYYDQLKLRSAAAAAADDDDEWDQRDDRQSSAAGKKARAQQLARENEALRLELARMRAYVSGMQQSKGSGSRASSPAKKASFLGSVTRTLSRLNPFRGVWGNKHTSGIADGRHGNTTRDHLAKPKKRRFSIG